MTDIHKEEPAFNLEEIPTKEDEIEDLKDRLDRQIKANSELAHRIDDLQRDNGFLIDDLQEQRNHVAKLLTIVYNLSENLNKSC